jgi:hypothetical protein
VVKLAWLADFFLLGEEVQKIVGGTLYRCTVSRVCGSVSSYDSQLVLSAIEKAHDPGSCFAAVVLVRILCACATTSTGTVALAISLDITSSAGNPSVGHE